MSIFLRLVRPRMMLSWQVEDLVSVSTLPLVAGPLFSLCVLVYIALLEECRARGGDGLESGNGQV